MSDATLERENAAYCGTGGVSAENRSFGFRAAFLDVQSNTIYPSRYPDGRPAPFHLLDGLPEDVILARNGKGKVSAVKASVISGFVLDGRFYTRDAAAEIVAQAA